MLSGGSAGLQARLALVVMGLAVLGRDSCLLCQSVTTRHVQP
jgi:hypothetical protein